MMMRSTILQLDIYTNFRLGFKLIKMKNIFLILFSGIVFSLNAQDYNSYTLDTHIGSGWQKERGVAASYDIAIRKHLGLGIYGVFSHGIANAENKISISNSLPNKNKQLIDLSQLSFWGLGIAKNLVLTNKGRLNLSLIAQSIQQNRFQLTNLEYNQEGILDVQKSTDTYTTRNDFGFSVTIDYQYALSNQVSIGIFSRYQSTPDVLFFGLKASAGFNFKANQKSTPESKVGSNNLLELRIAYGSGDGGNNSWMYDLAYGYKVKNRITLLAKFSIAQGGRNLNSLFFPRKELLFDSVHITDDNESDNPVLEPVFFSCS